MTLEQLLLNRTPNKTLTAGRWSSYCWEDSDNLILNINHYWTQMLQYRLPKRSWQPIPVRYISHVDLGWGSVSDQQGMNRIFIALGIPWYYARRKGHAKIIDLRRFPCHPDLPMYLRDPTERKAVYGYTA
jgi:hypothetical protein